MSDAPISSYSDPIYDRLDLFAQHLKRQWPVYILAIVVITATVVVVVQRSRTSPEAAAAAAFAAAQEISDTAQRIEAMRAVGADGSAPAFRAIALNEVAQAKLGAPPHRDLAGALAAANDMVAAAAVTADANLQLTALLTKGGALLEAGEFAQAEAAFSEAVRRAGANPRLKAERYAGLVGAAQAMAKLGRRDDAIAQLEPLLTTSDRGADRLIEIARVFHWRLKREAAASAAPAGGPATAAAR